MDKLDRYNAAMGRSMWERHAADRERASRRKKMLVCLGGYAVAVAVVLVAMAVGAR